MSEHDQSRDFIACPRCAWYAANEARLCPLHEFERREEPKARHDRFVRFLRELVGLPAVDELRGKGRAP